MFDIIQFKRHFECNMAFIFLVCNNCTRVHRILLLSESGNLGIIFRMNSSIVLRMQSDEPIFLSLKHLFVIHSVSITIFRNQISDVKSPREGINIAE